jgi:DNA mismatch endonuclease (patch repair protein)
MADIVPPDVRSRMMSGIRSMNTKPELILRSSLHRAGFRFRLHDNKLPGKPDMVFPRWRAVLLAHSCFWHGHDCHLFKWPKTREEFRRTKTARNREVYARANARLENAGWRRGFIWECALKGRTKLPIDEVIYRCAAWLYSDAPQLEIHGQSQQNT